MSGDGPRRPTHWGDTRRVSVGHGHNQAVPEEIPDDVTPTPQLVERIAARVPTPLSPREQQLADALADVLSDSLGRRAELQHRTQTDQLLALSSRAPVIAAESINNRLDELEDWRSRLTGRQDSNGRIGELTRRVEDIRRDVGTTAECAEVRDSARSVRAVKRWFLAALGTAALSIGGSAWTLINSRDEATRWKARIEFRLEMAEKAIERSQPR